jgi:hypothetical protein
MRMGVHSLVVPSTIRVRSSGRLQILSGSDVSPLLVTSNSAAAEHEA